MSANLDLCLTFELKIGRPYNKSLNVNLHMGASSQSIGVDKPVLAAWRLKALCYTQLNFGRGRDLPCFCSAPMSIATSLSLLFLLLSLSLLIFFTFSFFFCFFFHAASPLSVFHDKSLTKRQSTTPLHTYCAGYGITFAYA